jgi:hypothetical protein
VSSIYFARSVLIHVIVLVTDELTTLHVSTHSCNRFKKSHDATRKPILSVSLSIYFLLVDVLIQLLYAFPVLRSQLKGHSKLIYRFFGTASVEDKTEDKTENKTNEDCLYCANAPSDFFSQSKLLIGFLQVVFLLL